MPDDLGTELYTGAVALGMVVCISVRLSTEPMLLLAWCLVLGAGR